VFVYKIVMLFILETCNLSVLYGQLDIKLCTSVSHVRILSQMLFIPVCT
jgi:hypothetical protein